MRNVTSKGTKLIEKLLAEPEKFNDDGSSYELLQLYFNGFSLDTLRELLAFDDYMVKRAAVWIVSELGSAAVELIDDVVPLIGFEDRYIKYHALESVMVCSTGDRVDEFVYVVQSLLDNDSVIRLLVMHLISNANDAQLRVAADFFAQNKSYGKEHNYGLLVLLKNDKVNMEDIIKMIGDNNALIRVYGAMASKRLYDINPELIKYALSSSDSDIKTFSENFISIQSQL